MSKEPSINWSLSSFFPSFDGPERSAFERELDKDIARLTSEAAGWHDLAGDAAHWEETVLGYEDATARLSHLASYVGCLASADATDERFTLAEARLNGLRAGLEKLSAQLRRALGEASAQAFDTFAARPKLASTRYALSRLRTEAKTRMTPDGEGLAADLGMDGIMAWGRLYDTLSGKLSFEMEFPDGRRERRAVSQCRSLMADADRRVRRAAFSGGNRAWESVTDITGAAINHIAGVRHTLNARRNVGHFLDVALHQAAITQKTLDAMFEAVLDRIEIPRRGVRLKAQAMGIPACAWYDMEAPFPFPDAKRVDYREGVDIVRASFEKGYPKLARHFDEMLDKHWIEAQPSDKKRPGAYCTNSMVSYESRVFMSFQGSMGDVSTLAHEVGHAFHAEVLSGRRALESDVPMTLAETASTFAEALLADGLLRDTTLRPVERALLLGKVVSDGASFLLNVPARFFFEKKFYEERLAGEVPPRRLSELMVEAEQKLFGDSLAAGDEDPLFWASKLHFFIPDLCFYNFPYTFGYLLSRGLYAMYQQEGPPFLQRYEAFLAATGNGMAHDVARETLGRDLEAPEFWAEAIDTLEAPTDELETLLPLVGASSA